jgi:hypothetical protein
VSCCTKESGQERGTARGEEPSEDKCLKTAESNAPCFFRFFLD